MEGAADAIVKLLVKTKTVHNQRGNNDTSNFEVSSHFYIEGLLVSDIDEGLIGSGSKYERMSVPWCIFSRSPIDGHIVQGCG